MVFFPLSSILQGFDAPLKSWGADSVSLANCPSTQARTSACRSPARLHEVTVNAKPSWSSPGTASVWLDRQEARRSALPAHSKTCDSAADKRLVLLAPVRDTCADTRSRLDLARTRMVYTECGKRCQNHRMNQLFPTKASDSSSQNTRAGDGDA